LESFKLKQLIFSHRVLVIGNSVSVCVRVHAGEREREREREREIGLLVQGEAAIQAQMPALVPRET
jgi:hypothetical protein